MDSVATKFALDDAIHRGCCLTIPLGRREAGGWEAGSWALGVWAVGVHERRWRLVARPAVALKVKA